MSSTSWALFTESGSREAKAGNSSNVGRTKSTDALHAVTHCTNKTVQQNTSAARTMHLYNLWLESWEARRKVGWKATWTNRTKNSFNSILLLENGPSQRMERRAGDIKRATAEKRYPSRGNNRSKHHRNITTPKSLSARAMKFSSVDVSLPFVVGLRAVVPIERK